MTTKRTMLNHAADDPLLSPMGPEALRASFGDRKLDISRKITACVACRKLKIKCHMPGAGAPCSRCQRRGLSCTVNRSLQALLEDDAGWKQTVTRKIHAIEAFMETVRGQLPTLSQQPDDAQILDEDDFAPEPSSRRENLDVPEVSTEARAYRGWEVRMDIESAPAIIPAACVGEVKVSTTTKAAAAKSEDIITEGVISVVQADALVNLYAQRLDHYLYSILGDAKTVDTIRMRSPLLLAAICTVASLHSGEMGQLFDRCHLRFISLAGQMAMADGANMDDIRGLCIGAFWLHDLSWNLISIAVRASTQNHLHRAFHKALSGDRLSYLQTRLWYHVFVADRHFSIPYGRPSMITECEAVQLAQAFLRCSHATEDDVRLVSQVEIWAIPTQAVAEFGFDVDTSLSEASVRSLRRLIMALDTWRAGVEDRFATSKYVGNYPRKGVGLHYYFAKLYLCSHAFRGVSPGGSTPPRSGNSAMVGIGAPNSRLDPDIEEVGSFAIYAAKAILRTIIGDTEIQAHLDGLSLYFDTMIVFAVVFLLKAVSQYRNLIPVDKREILSLVGEVSVVLNRITADMHRQHLLVAIARGVETLLARCKAGIATPPGPPGGIEGEQRGAQQVVVQPEVRVTQDWTGMLVDSSNPGLEWSDFDFLATQDIFAADNSWMEGLNVEAHLPQS